jgi:hypothetical protein
MAALQPCHRRSTTLPELIEELVEEILLRIRPDEPAHLVGATLVCKAWRRIILSDPGFLRCYRAFHGRRPPLLGFFYNNCWDLDLPLLDSCLPQRPSPPCWRNIAAAPGVSSTAAMATSFLENMSLLVEKRLSVRTL